MGRMTTEDSSLCLVSCVETEQLLSIDKYPPGQRECHQQQELPTRMLSGLTLTVLHSGSRAGLKSLSRSDCFDKQARQTRTFLRPFQLLVTKMPN